MNPGQEHLYNLLETHIEENKEQAFVLLKNLVQQNSIQGHEAGAQAVVHNYIESWPVEIKMWDLALQTLSDSPYFISDRTDFKGCPNLVARLKGSGDGRSILLNGHIDVVPEGEIEKWTDDPYSGAIREGKMYGRGTTDMKGGNVSLLMAMEAIIACGIQLKGDVLFESVIEEESGGAGTLAASLMGFKADAAIIPEPTGMKLFIKQQGSMWFRISVAGKSAHGGTRYEGVSAIEKAQLLHKAILQLEKERNQAITDPLYKQVPIPIPINIGTVSGGTWPSSVPDMVVMEGRMGVGPEEEMGSARKALRKCIDDACKGDEWLTDNPAKLDFFGAQWLPNSVETNEPIVSVLGDNFQQIFESQMIIEASPWGTDAGILNKVTGTTTLVIGPGETRLAHYPDEYIDLNQMTQAAKLFARTILDWCGVAAPATSPNKETREALKHHPESGSRHSDSFK